MNEEQYRKELNKCKLVREVDFVGPDLRPRSLPNRVVKSSGDVPSSSATISTSATQTTSRDPVDDTKFWAELGLFLKDNIRQDDSSSNNANNSENIQKLMLAIMRVSEIKRYIYC